MTFMPDPKTILLYVENPAVSAAFYTDLLGRSAVEASANFVMFALESGLFLGLWARAKVEPASPLMGGGGEICFPVGDRDTVTAWHADWSRRGLRVIQVPTKMDFGFTFVAVDPDGHRLRVFSPEAP